LKYESVFAVWRRLCLAHIGTRQPAGLDTASRLRASMGACIAQGRTRMIVFPLRRSVNARLVIVSRLLRHSIGATGSAPRAARSRKAGSFFGTKRTIRPVLTMSVRRGRADSREWLSTSELDPERSFKSRLGAVRGHNRIFHVYSFWLEARTPRSRSCGRFGSRSLARLKFSR
jgi:hypothetical protein